MGLLHPVGVCVVGPSDGDEVRSSLSHYIVREDGVLDSADPYNVDLDYLLNSCCVWDEESLHPSICFQGLNAAQSCADIDRGDADPLQTLSRPLSRLRG